MKKKETGKFIYDHTGRLVRQVQKKPSELETNTTARPGYVRVRGVEGIVRWWRELGPDWKVNYGAVGGIVVLFLVVFNITIWFDERVWSVSSHQTTLAMTSFVESS